jgi:hypothetical protein
VDGTKALAEIKARAAVNRVAFTSHALARMAQRGANRRDVLNALGSASGAQWQTDHETWKVDGGVDQDGDELTVCVLIEGDLIVCTLF